MPTKNYSEMTTRVTDIYGYTYSTLTAYLQGRKEVCYANQKIAQLYRRGCSAEDVAFFLTRKKLYEDQDASTVSACQKADLDLLLRDSSANQLAGFRASLAQAAHRVSGQGSGGDGPTGTVAPSSDAVHPAVQPEVPGRVGP